ncbi:MAG: DUF427 domain-containing protein [bacterium]|nr:DUF427 domain-containing protein [bacterium]
MMRPPRIEPGPGQESVWDYPRPPRAERVAERIRIVFNGVEVANSVRAWRVLETSHAPTYYFPAEDVRRDLLKESGRRSFCEWKGQAAYVTLGVGGRVAENVGWFYSEPTAAFHELKNHHAFYAGPMDACFVGDERVTPQPGGFYGGWVTTSLAGPFKGERGTEFW